jgi:hypothetical protein
MGNNQLLHRKLLMEIHYQELPCGQCGDLIDITGIEMYSTVKCYRCGMRYEYDGALVSIGKPDDCYGYHRYTPRDGRRWPKLSKGG